MVNTAVGLVLGAFMTNFSAAVYYGDCGSQYTLLEANVQGCLEAPCLLELGKWYNITSKFESVVASSTLTSNVFYTIFNVNTPALTTPSQPCDSLMSSTCPVTAGQVYEYSAEVYADPNLLPTRGLLQWELFSENQNKVICFVISVRLYEPEVPIKTRNIEKHSSLNNIRERRRRQIEGF